MKATPSRSRKKSFQNYITRSRTSPNSRSNNETKAPEASSRKSFGNRFKLTLSYLFYTSFIWIIVIVPFLLLLVFGEIMIDTDPSRSFFVMSIVGVILLGLISVVGLFITYPFFRLIRRAIPFLD